MTIHNINIIPIGLEYAILANCIIAGPDNLKREAETKLKERFEAGRVAVESRRVTETSYEDAVAYGLSLEAQGQGLDFWRSFRDLAMAYKEIR